MFEPPSCTTGLRMGHEPQFSAVEFAPTAGITIAQLDEVDWTVLFRGPRSFQYLSLLHIDLYKRTGADEGAETIVFQANKTL